MRRLSVMSSVAVAVVVAAGAPAASAAVASDTASAAPAPVSHVRAYDDRPATTLDWVDPTSRFDHVVVRYRRGSVAPTHRHGHFRGHHADAGRHAHTVRLTHLSRDTVYSVTVWTVNRRGDHSAPRHAHFTTDGGQKTGRYTARYTDQAGHPLAGVVATAYFGFTEYTATSGRDGRLVLRVPSGSYEVDTDPAHATGGLSDPTGYVGTTRFVIVHPRRVRSGGTIALRTGGAVRIHVVDRAGRPVAGAEPELTPVSPYVQPDQNGNYFVSGSVFFGADSLATAHTGTGGNATLTGVPGSTAFQVCVAPDALLTGGSDGHFLSACTSSAGLARPAGTVTTMTLTVDRTSGGTVTGRVRSQDGRGHGTSFVYVETKRNVAAAVQTTHDGRFRAGGLAPGTYRVCASDGSLSGAGRTGYRSGCAAHRVTIDSASHGATVTIVRRVAAAATGTVTGPNGVPAPDVDVQVGFEAGAVTDFRGHFLVKGLSGGRHSLCASGFGDLNDRALPFGVRGDCGKHKLHFTARPGLIRTGLDARLHTGSAVSGTVVDERGRPVASAEVAIGRGTDKVGDETYSDTTDADGRFAFDGLGSGRYKLCARSRASGADSDDLFDFDLADVHAGCRHVALQVGHRRHGIRIVLPTTAAVHVTVVDEHGRGVAGVDAALVTACHQFCDPGTTLFPRTTSVAAGGLTKGHGSAVLTGLRPGRYAVCLFAYYGVARSGTPPTGYADRCSGTTFGLTVRAGHTTHTRIVLHPAGSVSGRITDSTGHPLKGAVVHVADSAADDLPADDTEFEVPLDADTGGASATPGYFSTTAADGTYTVRSVRPGDRLVCVDAKHATGGTSTGGYLSQCVGGRVGSTKRGSPVTLKAGVPTDGTDLALAAGGSVAGTVSSPVSRGYTSIVLFRGQNYVAQLHPDATGDYTFRRVVPGTYSVCVAAFTRKSATGRCYRDVAWDPETATGPATDATAVQVAAGATTTRVDVTVPH